MGALSFMLFVCGGCAGVLHFRLREECADNIDAAELQAFRRLADEVLGYDDASLALAMANGTMTEVMCNA